MKTLAILLMLATPSVAELYEYDGPTRWQMALRFTSQFEKGEPRPWLHMAKQAVSFSIDLPRGESHATIARWGMSASQWISYGFTIDDGTQDQRVRIMIDPFSFSTDNVGVWPRVPSDRFSRQVAVPTDAPGVESFTLTGHYAITDRPIDVDDILSIPFSCVFESTTESAFPDFIRYGYSSTDPDILYLGVGGAEFFATEPLGSPVINGEVNDLWITSISVGEARMTAKVGGSAGMLGDVNWDFRVNGHDVSLFVRELLSGPYDPLADMNEDSQLNGLDIDPFVSAVIGAGSALQAIPEPSGVTLALLAVVALAFFKTALDKETPEA